MAAKTGSRKVRAYDDEFKVKAVLLCLEIGVLTKDVEARHGVYHRILQGVDSPQSTLSFPLAGVWLLGSVAGCRFART